MSLPTCEPCAREIFPRSIDKPFATRVDLFLRSQFLNSYNNFERNALVCAFIHDLIHDPPPR